MNVSPLIVTGAGSAVPRLFVHGRDIAVSCYADTYFDVTAGIDILTADGVDLKLTYDGRFAEDSTSLALSAKAAIPF